jgi:hypothetical protein
MPRQERPKNAMKTNAKKEKYLLPLRGKKSQAKVDVDS